jgi:hypothetical protein
MRRFLSVMLAFLVTAGLVAATPEVVGASAPRTTETVNVADQSSLDDSPLFSQIYYGNEVPDPNPYPWHVGLYDTYSGTERALLYCGGALIAPDWVLTAAHCVTDSWWGDPYDPSTISVTVGVRNRTTVTPDDLQAVAEVYVHPEWDQYSFVADLALLRLVDASRNAEVPPLALVSGMDPAPGTPAKALGWGQIKKGGLPLILREADLEIVADPPQGDCRAIGSDSGAYGGYVPEWMMCAVGAAEETPASSCYGDSGSPLIVDNNGTWEMVGVTSWGYACGDYYLPTVYARVGRMQGWIEMQMANPNGRACGRANPNRFFDVPPTEYYATAADCLASVRITTGWNGDSNFYNPSGVVTRAQLAAFLWRMEGAPGHPQAPLLCGYADVAKTDYFARGACWMKKQSITTGWNGNPSVFNPGAPVTRGQMAAFLWRAAGQPAASCTYDDVSEGAYYAEAVCWLKASRITITGNTYNPDGVVTRGQMAAFLHRYGIATKRWFLFDVVYPATNSPTIEVR